MKTQNLRLPLTANTVLLGAFLAGVLLTASGNSSAQTREATPVTVENTPDHPALVSLTNPRVLVCLDPVCPNVVRKESDLHPFQEQVFLSFGAGNSGDFQSFQVPAGKRLVIEFVSVFFLIPAGQELDEIQIQTIANGSFVGHQVPVRSQGRNKSGFMKFVGAQQMRVYADGGTNVNILASESSAPQGSGGSVTISGYLIDL